MWKGIFTAEHLDRGSASKDGSNHHSVPDGVVSVQLVEDSSIRADLLKALSLATTGHPISNISRAG